VNTRPSSSRGGDRSVTTLSIPISTSVAAALVELCAALYAEARLLIASARSVAEEGVASLLRDLHAEVVREVEATVREVAPLVDDLDARAQELADDLTETWTDHGDALVAACAAEEGVGVAAARAVAEVEEIGGLDRLAAWLRDLVGLRRVVRMQLASAF